jgi:hypothetical protein
VSDREKIIAACVEARFFAEGWGVPAVIEIDGVQPFEMFGYDRPLLWETPDYKGNLPRMYNTGVNTIGFHAAGESLTEDIRGKDWLTITGDGKHATTVIRRYSGGLNGDGIEATLVKIGDDWFVTDMEQRYVS